jgi:hypothetical protein
MRTLPAWLIAWTFMAAPLPASAGPAFAYSWLETGRPFERCMQAAGALMAARAYEHVETTRFGVTGETASETLYVNCEDHRHVSVVLMRAERPRHGEIDALVADLQARIEGDGVQ